MVPQLVVFATMVLYALDQPIMRVYVPGSVCLWLVVVLMILVGCLENGKRVDMRGHAQLVGVCCFQDMRI